MTRIKELQKEIELTERLIQLTKELDELKAKAPAERIVHVPYPVYPEPITFPQITWWKAEAGSTSMKEWQDRGYTVMCSN